MTRKLGRGLKHAKQETLKRIITILALPVLTGILLGISSLPSKVWFIGFFAFLPLLLGSEKTLDHTKPLPVFGLQVLISLVIFYLWVSLWIFRTANAGFLIGFLIVIPFVFILSPYILLRKWGSKAASIYFVSAWLTAELIQSYYQIGSPFFNLGHNPAACPQLIQWYEYTGSAGGSLWILIVNFALFQAVQAFLKDRSSLLKKFIWVLSLLLVPGIISLFIFNNYREKGSPTEVLIVHPSTDNSDVKYRINIYELMDIYLGIMIPQLGSETEYVVLPETAITNAGWVSDLNNNLVLDRFYEKTVSFPSLKLVTGSIVYEAIPDVKKISGYRKMPGIRFSQNYDTWYYTYNAALQAENGRPVQMRVKEGLVPYQEYSPYPRLMPRLKPVGIDFQFSSRERNLKVFSSGSRKKTAALICYELVYGSKFVLSAREGAEAFFVLLNEGWYTEAPKVSDQFLQLSVVRAIENRRCIAHSSNMGTSAFINQKGEIDLCVENKSPATLKKELLFNKKRTFVTIFGDYLSFTALASAVLVIFIQLIQKRH